MMGRSLPPSRNFWRLPLLVAAATLALACGGDSASGPSSSPVGSYRLSTYNGKPVPQTLFSDTGFTIALAAGSLALTADGSFLATITTNETIEGHLSVYVDSSTGRWTQTGATLVFVGSDSTKQTAGWDGSRITLSDTSTAPPSTFVYARR